METRRMEKYTSEDLELSRLPGLQSLSPITRLSANALQAQLAEGAAGYVKLSNAIAAGKTLKAGDKVYEHSRQVVIFVQIGTKSPGRA